MTTGTGTTTRTTTGAAGPLLLAQAAAFSVSGIALTLGPLALIGCAAGAAWAGALVGALGLAAGLGAALGGRGVARRPRAWLAAGHAAYATGGLAAASAAGLGSAAGIVAAVALMGAGQGVALMGRAVVTAMSPPGLRGRAAGRMLAAGAIGAIAGPVAVGGLGMAARAAALDPVVAPWMAVSAIGVAAMAAVVRAAPRHAPSPAGDDSPGRRPAAPRMAVLALVAAQATMVGAMALAPGRIHAATGSEAAMSLAVAGHLAGMYALAPLAGRLIDRRGHTAGIAWGAAVSALGAALVGAPWPAVVALGLVLAGVGWTGAYLAATAVLAGAGRTGALGAAELGAASAGAAAAAGAALAAVALGPVVVAGALAVPVLTTLAACAAAGPAGERRPSAGRPATA